MPFVFHTVLEGDLVQDLTHEVLDLEDHAGAVLEDAAEDPRIASADWRRRGRRRWWGGGRRLRRLGVESERGEDGSGRRLRMTRRAKGVGSL